MEFFVEKSLKGSEAVRAHKLFRKAVFIECGLHSPVDFCYDHHEMTGGGDFSLSSAGMIQQELIRRRKMPNVIVMNHVRHLDNIMALYLLYFRGMASHPDTSKIVAAADLMDRIGPLATASLPAIERSVLETAQSLIPFKEWEAEDADLQKAAIKAVESLRNMVTRPIETVKYESIWQSVDGKFIVVKSGQAIGNTLYDQGYDAYVAWDGKTKWTLARASEYVPFNISEVTKELNKLEGYEEGKGGWGGRSVIGGSPQGVGTKLTSEQIVETVKKYWS